METNERDVAGRYGRRLLQLGAALFLCGLLVGLAVPKFTVPRLGLSTHLLGLMQGTFLMVAGLLWPRLRLTPRSSRLGLGLAAYGCLAAWMANLLGAIWGAGATIVPFAAGAARGTGLQEGVVRVLLISSAPCLIGAVAILLWGLRDLPHAE
jgi:hydroxylaminobenzene mutase